MPDALDVQTSVSCGQMMVVLQKFGAWMEQEEHSIDWTEPGEGFDKV